MNNKNKTQLCCLQSIDFIHIDRHKFKVEREEDIPSKWKPKECVKQNGLQAKMVTRDTECNYIMIKRSIHQEDSIIINI